MNRLLGRFGISAQVTLIGATALLGFVLIGALYAGVVHQSSTARGELDQAVERLTLTNQVVIGLLQLRRHEKDFQLRHDNKFVAMHAATAAIVIGQMNELAGRLPDRENQVRLQNIRDGVTTYMAQFKLVADNANATGLTEEQGLRGALRTAVHDVEAKVLNGPEPKLTISMLMMRRHEKDFIERQDTKYAEQLQQESVVFGKLLQTTPLPPADLSEINGDLVVYLRDFTALKEATTRGLEHLTKLSAIFAEIQPRTDELYGSIAKQATEIKAADDATQAALSTMLAVGLAGVGAITVLLAWLVGRGIARPVAAMTVAMTQLAAGDTAINIPGQGRGDEVGAMAAAVAIFKDSMIESARLTDEQAAGRAAKERRQAAMDQHTQDFGISISGVMAALTVAAGDMHKAAVVMTRAATSVQEQAAGTAEGAARSSMDLIAVAAAVQEMTASIDEIARQVTSATDVARDAVRQSEAGQGSIKLLAEAASHIGNVVGLISDIANQTNLLALNATIEAARAGDAGRGFAVVAGEVKALATQTGKATSEIGGQISAIQNATASAISVMNEIESVIGRMDQISAAIAAAVEEQSVATRGIAASVQTVTGAIEETTRSMHKVADNADEAGRVSQTVTSGSDDIGRQAGLLRTEVDQFLHAVSTDDGENRRYERMNGNGTLATIEIPGRQPEPAPIRDIARGGLAVDSSLSLPAGAEIGVRLPGNVTSLSGRVVRTGNGILAIVLSQNQTTFEVIDRFMDTLRTARAA
jgi:methyl-accepting chemotaxis protein